MSGENVTTVAGSELWVSATGPATNTKAGFEACDWVKVGEITDMGPVLGREYNTSTYGPVDSAQQIEKKGSYKLGATEFKCGWDDDDEGQQIVFAASENYSVPAFKVVKQNNALRYFTAQVSKFVEDMGSVDNTVMGSMTLLRQTDTIRVAAPAPGP
jgi:hypothetical protein